MAVIPVSFDDTAHTVILYHHEGGHGGTANLPALTWEPHADGTPDYHWLAVPCPVCASVSYHPCGGGAAPQAVQRLFLRRYLLEAALALGTGTAGWQAALAYLRARVAETDGDARFLLAGLAPGG